MNSAVSADPRLNALRRFAIAITVLTLLGHSVLEFEQPDVYVLVALITGYCSELLLETVSAWRDRRPLRYRGGVDHVVNFFLPTHITSLALAMFMLTNDRLGPIVFAVLVAVCSKYILRVQTEKGSRHFMNPSNTGIVITLMVFPWVGIATPSQFTAELLGYWDWLAVGFVICLGSFLNWRLTRRIPLILAWVGAFMVQAIARNWFLGEPLMPMLAPMTGFVFYLFTFYMVSDPGTTPAPVRHQILFGSAVGLVYGCLMLLNVRFTIFFALFVVCALRGGMMWLAARQAAMQEQTVKS